MTDWMTERHQDLGSYAYAADMKKIDDEGALDLLSLEYLVEANACVVGTPEDCVATCRLYEEAGIDLLLCLVNPWKVPHETVMQTIELMGNEVIPEFRPSVHRRRPAASTPSSPGRWPPSRAAWIPAPTSRHERDPPAALHARPARGHRRTLPTDDRVVVEDGDIDVGRADAAIRVRIYSPRARRGPGPAVVFFHGGAFVLGDVYAEEHRCLRYAADAGCVVVSVEYRLAPEDPFPSGFDDCFAALEWTVAHAGELGVDPGASPWRATAPAARCGRGGTQGPGPGRPGARPAGPRLPGARRHHEIALDAGVRHHAAVDPHGQRPHVGALPRSPRRAGRGLALCRAGGAGDVAGLAPAYVMTAELDPLRDEAILYALRMMAAGVAVELHSFAGACHGFDSLAWRSAIGRRALDEQVDALVRGLALRP